MNKGRLHSLAAALFALALFAAGCEKADETEAEYGYVEFKVYKTASAPDSGSAASETSAATKAATQTLDLLSDAHKVRVSLQYGSSSISQTLILNSYDSETAEWGLRSEKLQLLTGDYRVVGFYLYDSLDELLYTGSDSGTFTIVRGGLEVYPLSADAVERGKVSFRLVKQINNDPTTRATAENEDAGSYPFEDIACIDITVKNQFTQETTKLDSLVVTMTDDFSDQTHVGTDGGTYHNPTMYGACSGTFWLRAGNYRISSYTTYSDKKRRNPLETVVLTDSDVFTITDNELTEDVEVPIQLCGTAEYIKDYLALKAIWDKMGGENWSYYGQETTVGVNWNFDKDIDMWGDQPGVSLDDDGRVASLSLAGFGPVGNVPDEIGQLTALEALYLGTHSESIGGSIASASQFSALSSAERKSFREDYRDRILHHDIREHLSDGIKDYINRDPSQTPIPTSTSTEGTAKPLDMLTGVMTNGITGISRAIMRCNKLEILYVANSPMTDFFVDVEDTDNYGIDACKWSDFENLTDLEIYNTKLTSLPVEMLANLPDAISANLSRNPDIDGATLLENFKDLIRGDFGKTIQILYLGYNNLEDTPEFLSDEYNQMTSLGLLDLTYNSLTHVYPLGKEINLVDFYLDHNELTELPVADDGYLFGYYDVEEFTCTYNHLTCIPNAFNAKSAYTIESLDFSHNEITGVGTDKYGNPDPDFKGINVGDLDLSYNKLTEFPSELFEAGCPISVLILSGNGITEIREGALEGSKASYLETLDISYNQLTKIADSEFSSERLPYLYGLGLSYNSFSSFPLGPLYNRSMTVMEIRHQRDEEGNRSLRDWPTGLYTNVGLRAFYIGGNDLRKIDDTISTNIYIFEIADNPNIQIDLSDVCIYIQYGYYYLYYDKTQDIRGCDYLFQ